MQSAQSLGDHCREIDRCNQRGGRMLSVVDLVEAGTLERDVAAHCIAAVASGASFLVGASPGGAGKTTVMGALLNCVPADVVLRPAVEPLHADGHRTCWICHEIGPGAYYAYLWGEPLRRWFRLSDEGASLASNLHADTMEEVERQVLVQNDVPRGHLRRIGLVVFIEVRRTAQGWERRVTSVHESDGASDHRLLWDRARGWRSESRIVAPARIAQARAWLDEAVKAGVRTIREVRETFLQGGMGQS